MTIGQAIQREIDAARKIMPYGDPAISFDAKDILIDQNRKLVTVTMATIMKAFEPQAE